MESNEVTELAALLRNNSDQILNSASKLLLTTKLLEQLNRTLDNLTQCLDQSAAFHVIDSTANSNEVEPKQYDAEFLHDIVQKIISLKLVPDYGTAGDQSSCVDIHRFKSLKLLELYRVNVASVHGLDRLKSSLEYVICSRSLCDMQEFLLTTNSNSYNGGGGAVWTQLKEAVFQHNSIESLDGCLRFAPQLQTLDISHNWIRNAQALECLNNLRHVNLGFNQMESIPIFNTQLCDKLQTLVLRNNYLDDITGLFVLTNLKELDLSYNCLVEHNVLTPVTQLKVLESLNLKGNPLSFHPKHRNLTCPYLHQNVTTKSFVLDHAPLKRSEQLLVGKVHPMRIPLRPPSLHSSTSETTVIASPDHHRLYHHNSFTLSSIQQMEEYNNHHHHHQQRCDSVNHNNQKEYIQTSDMEISTHSNISNDVPVNVREEYSELHDGIGMQDSGFVPSARPVSPSECSIDNSSVETSLPARVCVAAEIHCIPRSISNTLYSVTAVDNEDQYARRCESDIEVISNPSQSSIEVLDGGPSNRLKDPQTNATAIRDLSTIEAHQC